MARTSLTCIRHFTASIFTARIAWGALCAAHAGWLFRALAQDADEARIASLLVATAFLAFLTLRPRSSCHRPDLAAIITWSLIIALLHVNVVRRSIDPTGNAANQPIPLMISSAAAAGLLAGPVRSCLIRRAERLGVNIGRLFVGPMWRCFANAVPFITAQRTHAFAVSPRGPPA